MLSLMLLAALQATPSEATLARVSQSIFRVNCEVPAGQDRWRTKSHGSAFAWGEPDEIVTALHVVATCGRISLESETRGGVRRAMITRVVVEHDLAQLKLQQEPDAPWSIAPLSASSSSPSLWDPFVVVGYALGMPTMQPKRLSYHRRMPLRDMVPALVLQQILAAKWFDAETDVHAFSEGHLVPGHSGAPIIDQRGMVVAVAQGGLENGTSEIGWGLGVAYLNGLPSGLTSVPSRLGRIDALFSAEQKASVLTSPASVRCGGARLTRIRRAKLNELRATTDDPQGLLQLETVLSNGNPINTGDFEYDIWRDLETGASIPIPRGMTPTAESGRCALRDRNYGVALYFTVDPVANFQSAMQAAMNFQQSWLGNRPVTVDAGFTYLAPLQRWDGLVANRTALLVHENRLFNGFAVTVPVNYAFQSVSTKGRGSLGMVTVREEFDVETTCYSSFMLGPDCNRIRDRFPLFAQFVLGTHLAGWPLG